MAQPEIPKLMKAVQIVGYKQPLQLNEIPVPTIGDNDILVKIGAAGFCHTDYQVWEGVYESPTPIVGSHEPVGTIVAVGPKAQAKWKIGQRVGPIFFQHACHNCWGCDSTNDIRHCVNKEMRGLMQDGGFAEYMVGDADNTVLLPDSITFEQAAPLMCAGHTVWTGIERVEIPTTEPIGIIGIGGLGSLGVQFAKALGHPVVAIDKRPQGRALATEFGLKADLVVSPDDEGVLDKIRSWAGKGGLAATIVCCDDVSVAEWSLKLLRPFGKTVPLGLPPDGFKCNAFDLVFNNLVVIGSVVGTKAGLEMVLETVAKHNIRSHVTTFSIENAVNFCDMYAEGHVKGRLVMKIG
ncbi:chaperonin 10-like protein [Lophiotrema nucula]|uniref:Chaperonin 10-like protein n=1 Tax=Lophiotrema nucula TaxID=690887 RepID=A0A6A5Z1H6_9PLEO|nr:chaperonin 10-like protein [Lophiotrema nucula]